MFPKETFKFQRVLLVRQSVHIMGINILSYFMSLVKSLMKKIIIGNLSPHRGEKGRRATFNLVVYRCFYIEMKWESEQNLNIIVYNIH